MHIFYNTIIYHVMRIPFSGWAWVNPTLDLTRSSHILNHSNHHQGSLISLSRGGLISHEVNPNHLRKIITQHIGTYPRWALCCCSRSWHQLKRVLCWQVIDIEIKRVQIQMQENPSTHVPKDGVKIKGHQRLEKWANNNVGKEERD